ncbi:MAG: hypothetical protein U1E53_03825 [Dongiaceae bacterium]
MNEHSFIYRGAGPMAAVANLREIARRTAIGMPVDGPLQTWLAACLEQFLQRRAPSIEAAFGLRAPRGGVPWWLEEAIRQRDDALRELAARFLAGQSVTAQARRIHCEAVRYAASAWRHDRAAGTLPERHRGRLQESLWRAFRSGAPMPICERQLRSILAR